MGHARDAARLLTTDDPQQAAKIAAFLTRENDRRRQTERTILEEARQMVRDAGYDSTDHRAIVVGKAGWHPGVMGIVASRLVEEFCRPVVLLHIDPDSAQAQGSARSVKGLSIHEAFSHCAHHFESWGGHAMAAGLRMDSARMDAFRADLLGYINDRLGPEDLVSELVVDADCTLDQVSVDRWRALQALAPFGQANPSPVLCARAVTLDRAPQPVGNQGQHLRLLLRQGDRLVDAIAFGFGDHREQLPAGVKLDVAFSPKLSQWQGRWRTELHVKDVRLLRSSDTGP
jgi:single-stranded-DNA-specific exonuclease